MGGAARTVVLSTATIRSESVGSEKKAATAACARARSVAAIARSASRSRTSRSARRRSKPAVSPAASRFASTSTSPCRRSRAPLSSRSRTCATASWPKASRRSARARRTASSTRCEVASTSADAAWMSSPRRPVIGRTCATIVMFSVTPATDSRSNVTRGFGQRPAASTSARASSIPARMARTLGLVGDKRANASASVSMTDCPTAAAGANTTPSAAYNTTLRINTSNEVENETDDGRTRQIRLEDADGRRAERWRGPRRPERRRGGIDRRRDPFGYRGSEFKSRKRRVRYGQLVRRLGRAALIQPDGAIARVIELGAVVLMRRILVWLNMPVHNDERMIAVRFVHVPRRERSRHRERGRQRETDQESADGRQHSAKLWLI